MVNEVGKQLPFIDFSYRFIVQLSMYFIIYITAPPTRLRSTNLINFRLRAACGDVFFQKCGNQGTFFCNGAKHKCDL